MAALGSAVLRRGGGAAPRLLAVAVSCQSCRHKATGDGGHGQPREQHPAAPGRVGSQPVPAEGADTKSYLWARYHEMKKLVYGKGAATSCRGRPLLTFFFFLSFFLSASRCLSPPRSPGDVPVLCSCRARSLSPHALLPSPAALCDGFVSLKSGLDLPLPILGFLLCGFPGCSRRFRTRRVTAGLLTVGIVVVNGLNEGLGAFFSTSPVAGRGNRGWTRTDRRGC